jgi:hypothetical protein
MSFRADSVGLLCRFAQHRLRAMRTAAGVDGYFAQAFGAFLRGGVGRLFAAVHARDQGVDRQDHEKVDRCCNQEERDAGVDELADGKRCPANGELDIRIILFADDQGDQRREESLGQLGDDSAESGADDHAYGHIHNISTQDEFLKPV